jgi:hypothetical protein
MTVILLPVLYVKAIFAPEGSGASIHKWALSPHISLCSFRTTPWGTGISASGYVFSVEVMELALAGIYIYSYGRTRQQGGGRGAIGIDKWMT